MITAIETTEPVIGLLVPTVCLDVVTKKLDRLAKKAGINYAKIDGETTIKSDRGYLECSRFEVSVLPHLAGWTFVARLEHNEAGTITACAPGEELPVEFRTAKPICQHCNMVRRRNDTFVLRSPDGKLFQIGRNCLADFLMCDASILVARAEFAAMVEELTGDGKFVGYGFPRGYCSTLHYVACAVALTKSHGFVKSSEPGSTRGEASFLAYPVPPRCDPDLVRAWCENQPTEADIKEAEVILAWTPDVNGDSDYGHNLSIALKCHAADPSRCGILASAPAAYYRAQGLDRRGRVKAAPAVTSAGFWSEVGKRSEIIATLERQVTIDGVYGTSILNSFRSVDGHVLVWFASGECPRGDCLGKIYLVKGTVKRHETRNGQAQTILSRCKVTEKS